MSSRKKYDLVKLKGLNVINFDEKPILLCNKQEFIK